MDEAMQTLQAYQDARSTTEDPDILLAHADAVADALADVLDRMLVAC
jgi:hypothetical protein